MAGRLVKDSIGSGVRGFSPPAQLQRPPEILGDGLRQRRLSELLDACADYVRLKKQKLTFEYILIKDLKDTNEQARLLAAHARKLGAKINLIPYNAVEGLDWERPDDFFGGKPGISFMGMPGLIKSCGSMGEPHGFFVLKRKTRGVREIFAAKFFGDRQFRDALHGLQPAAAKLRQR